MGFYGVIWGKAKEEEIRIGDDSAGLSRLGHLSNDKVPLLQSHKMEDNIAQRLFTENDSRLSVSSTIR